MQGEGRGYGIMYEGGCGHASTHGSDDVYMCPQQCHNVTRTFCSSKQSRIGSRGG